MWCCLGEYEKMSQLPMKKVTGRLTTVTFYLLTKKDSVVFFEELSENLLHFSSA